MYKRLASATLLSCLVLYSRCQKLCPTELQQPALSASAPPTHTGWYAGCLFPTAQQNQLQTEHFVSLSLSLFPSHTHRDTHTYTHTHTHTHTHTLMSTQRKQLGPKWKPARAHITGLEKNKAKRCFARKTKQTHHWKRKRLRVCIPD